MNRDSSVKSPAWIRPDDVMRVRKLKAKRKALQARMINSTTSLQILAPIHGKANNSLGQGTKRRNPFRCSPNKRSKLDEDSNLEISSDASLFRLLNPVETRHSVNNSSPKPAVDFSSFFNRELPVSSSSVDNEESPECSWSDKLTIDWSLKTRMRFKSRQPLPWKHNFKTSEEASGTTGFVRCLSTSEEDEDRTLDTSANAKFYQCCLAWQHPNLPWLQLFPRDNIKISSQTGVFGTDQKLSDSLHREWLESVRSLHQLLRVRQCPYFYVCGPNFTCLFRAAGVGGISQAHALISPTTRGFREAMKMEDIEFEMPFQKGGADRKGDGDDEIDDIDPDEYLRNKANEEEGEEAKSWLEDLGVETSQFPNLNPNRVKMDREKFKNIDRTPTSMVYVEGVDIQGLVNFLVNSRSCMATTGALAGVPPTLLAPVAFQGATLKVLKATGNTIYQDGETHHSMEIVGPIMPHTVHQLTSLLSNATEEFSVSFHPVISTRAFSKFKHQEVSSAPQAFAQEGLVDCGLDATVRSMICTPQEIQDSELPVTFREVTFKNKKFTWTDKL